jgi:flagellar motor switch protein FliN/FliY
MAETAQAVKENENAEEQKDTKTQAQSVQFAEAVGTESVGTAGSLDILLDMNVPVTVAIGKTEMTVRKLLQLGPGSVLQLDKPVDVPADLYLRDTKFATGNIVVVDGRFAVRIKQIIGTTVNTTPVDAAVQNNNEKTGKE